MTDPHHIPVLAPVPTPSYEERERRAQQEIRAGVKVRPTYAMTHLAHSPPICPGDRIDGKLPVAILDDLLASGLASHRKPALELEPEPPAPLTADEAEVAGLRKWAEEQNAAALARAQAAWDKAHAGQRR